MDIDGIVVRLGHRALGQRQPSPARLEPPRVGVAGRWTMLHVVGSHRLGDGAAGYARRRRRSRRGTTAMTVEVELEPLSAAPSDVSMTLTGGVIQSVADAAPASGHPRPPRGAKHRDGLRPPPAIGQPAPSPSTYSWLRPVRVRRLPFAWQRSDATLPFALRQRRTVQKRWPSFGGRDLRVATPCLGRAAVTPEGSGAVRWGSNTGLAGVPWLIRGCGSRPPSSRQSSWS